MSHSRLAVILAPMVFLVPSGPTPSPANGAETRVASIAGDYYHGGNASYRYFLSVTPDGHFSFIRRDCTDVSDRNFGGASLLAGHLILSPALPVDEEGFGGIVTDFHVIRWGDRVYLVPEAQKQAFCNAVNEGFEPRPAASGGSYLRRDDWNTKVSGLPSVPEDWERLLLKKPLTGKVIAVPGRSRARIDLGSDAGVWKGMYLWADTDQFGLVKVVDVEAKSCLISTDMFEFRMGQVVRSQHPKRR